MQKEKNKEVIQQKYMLLQMMKQQFNSLVEQKNMLDQRTNEILMTSKSMDDITKLDSNNESWSPLGSGVFAVSHIKDTNKVLIEVGAGVILKKDIESAQKIVSERLKELQAVDSQLMDELTNMNNQMQALEKELQQMVE